MEKVFIDGENLVFGRMASFVSKELLKGKSVFLINSEKVIVSGNKKVVVEKINSKRRMGRGGSLKGPKYPRREDLLLKRMIRGMLPMDRFRGKDALKRLRCFVGKGNLSDEELKNIKKIEHKKPLKYSTIKEISMMLK